ncbi:MAG: hypothetical protein U0894_12365 [Pirellulales bacterium]
MNQLLRKLIALVCVAAFALPTGWCCASGKQTAGSVVDAAMQAAPSACCHHKTKTDTAPSTRAPAKDGSCCGCTCSERTATLSGGVSSDSRLGDSGLGLQTVQLWVIVPPPAVDLTAVLLARDVGIDISQRPTGPSLQTMLCIWRC